MKVDDLLGYSENEYKETKEYIDDFVSKFDSIEALFLMSKLCYGEEAQYPIVPFLFNMYLKQKPEKKVSPSLGKIKELKEKLIKYYEYFQRYISNKNGSDLDVISKKQYILGLINPEMYPHQFEEKFKALFCNVRDDFFGEFGFCPLSALLFAQSINGIYSEKFKRNSNDFLFEENDLIPLETPENSRMKLQGELRGYLNVVSIKPGEGNQSYGSLFG